MATVNNLCSPALIYLVFSLTHVIIDIFKEQYNQAFFKFIVMIFFTILLHLLCMRGLGVVSWMIVFIPFISMSFLTAILLFVFGLDPSSGKIQTQQQFEAPDIRREIRKERRRERKYQRHLRDFEIEDLEKERRKVESLSESRGPPAPNSTTVEEFVSNLTI